MGLKSAYLLAYNGAVLGGWGYVLYLTLQTLLQGGSTHDLYKVTKLPLQISQTAAVLEIVHSLIGVVRAPFFTTTIQVFSRVWVVYGIINIAEAETTGGSIPLLKLGGVSLELNLFSLLLAWSITEVIRYAFFATKEIGVSIYPLVWLRYSTFILLYPIGVASELTMVYLAMPHIKAARPLSLKLPNAANFGFDYYIACWLIIAGYLPGLPQLYMYMLTQRKKVLGGGSKAKAA